MAEIKIQPKEQGGKWWMWLLPLLLLGLLAWFLTRDRGNEQTSATRDTTAAGMTAGTGAPASPGASGTTTSMSAGAVGTAVPSSATEFARFIAATDAKRDESGQHQYTSEGIRRLALAIEGSRAGANAGAQLAIMRAMADSLQESPSGSDRHSGMTRGAFDAAIIPLANLGGDASSRLQAAARAVRPERHLLAQKSEIQRFFETARDALQSSGATTTP